MKKQISLFIWAVSLFGMGPVFAETNYGTRAASSVDLTNGPAVRERTNVNYQKYETRSTNKSNYATQNNKNLYYRQPTNRTDLYKSYTTNASNSYTRNTTTLSSSRSEVVRSEMKRKYYLAHPFFQPLKGNFGSVTDLAYTSNSYDLDLTVSQSFIDATGLTLSDTKAKWDMGQITIKEDFSYGITDRLAVLGMLRFDFSDYTFDWSTATDDSMSDSGLNMFGLGLQWRFVDNTEWIATLSGYYQNQKDMYNAAIVDIKGGYKVATSTIYGLGRLWMLDFEGNAYGNGITDSGNGNSLFIAYNSDVSTTFYAELGAGVFTVLNEDWTLNAEAVYGMYDWHNQLSLKGAIGWQPNDIFALNLYAKASLFDTADGEDLSFYWAEPANNIPAWTYVGTAKVDNYSEYTVGLQAVVSF